jgi:rhodanese-related sulfurtransferase
MCLVSLLWAPNAQSTQIIETDKTPRIAVMPESWDFGKITESKTETHNFEVKNIGTMPLTIKGVTTSCGCTNASLSSPKIEPGEAATLKVDVDPQQIKSLGKTKRQVYIESNDPKEPLKTVSIFLEMNTVADFQKHSGGSLKSKPISKVNPVRELRPLTVYADGGIKPPAAFSNGVKPPPKISSRKLYSLIKAGRKVIILDVREENEYIGKHIPDAVWFPKSKFDKQAPEVLKKLEGIDKRTRVVTYCGAGHRSSYVAKKLREAGYNAYNLDGISFWEKENLPLIRGPKLPPSEEPSIIHLEEAYENYYLLFKDIVWIDVRDAQDYKRGHVNGALGIPLSEIESRINEIPKDKEIVLYCEGTWDGGSCEASRSAGRILIKNGYKQGNIKVFEDGYGSWENAGYPLGRQTARKERNANP